MKGEGQQSDVQKTELCVNMIGFVVLPRGRHGISFKGSVGVVRNHRRSQIETNQH